MENVTPSQFWLGILVVAIPQIVSLINNWRTAIAQEKAAKEAKEAQIHTSVPQVQTENWERLIQNYAKQIEGMANLQTENAELRKLPLKLVIIEQEMKQCHEDKEDWKRYSIRLTEQIKELGHVPLAFRRTPQDGDTQEKIATINKEMLQDPNKLQTIHPIQEEE